MLKRIKFALAYLSALALLLIPGATHAALTVGSTSVVSSGALTLQGTTSSAVLFDSGTTGTVNLGTGNNAKTINLGTGNAGNSINIGTNNTVADTIAIGSALDTITLGGTITLQSSATIGNTTANQVDIAGPSATDLHVSGDLVANFDVRATRYVYIGSVAIASGTGAPASTGAAAGTCRVDPATVNLPQGSLYLRTDGSTSTSLYVCTAQNTWTAK